jgi:hypothetical protein
MKREAIDRFYRATGRNLFDNAHAEFGDPLTRSEYGRTVFFKIVARI